MTKKQAKQADHQIQCALSALRANGNAPIRARLGLPLRIAKAHISELVRVSMPLGTIDTHDHGRA